MGISYCRREKCEHLTNLVRPYVGKISLDGPLYTACKAYPKGIPHEIREGDDPHHRVRDDQEGDWVYSRSEKDVDWKPPKIVLIPLEDLTATTREV